MSSISQSYANILSSQQSSSWKQSTTANSQPSSLQQASHPARAFSSTAAFDEAHEIYYEPNTKEAEATTYVLTLGTNKAHHKTMTTLRDKYFPRHLNKLDAHLTLFHALPGSKLNEDIVPSLENLARSTEKFHLLAATPFKLSKGIAIGVPKTAGGTRARELHQELKSQWKSFLSDQDKGGFAAHYTIMNKVDDQNKVEHAFSEVKHNFRASSATVEGLNLYQYNKGHWDFVKHFEFQDQP